MLGNKLINYKKLLKLTTHPEATWGKAPVDILEVFKKLSIEEPCSN